MDDSNKGALEFLEQLRRERDELNLLIEGIEKRLGIASVPARAQSDNLAPASPRVKVSIDNVPVGFFHNLSHPRAAEKLLRLNPGQPLTTQEMLDSFRKSGMTLNPKNAATILYTALSRNDQFERVAGKAWGLSEWYPEKKRGESLDTRTSAAQAASMRGRRAHGNTGPTRKATIHEWLKANGPHGRSEIITGTGLPEGTVGSLLSQCPDLFENRDGKWYAR
jgi:hypothetical protein